MALIDPKDMSALGKIGFVMQSAANPNFASNYLGNLAAQKSREEELEMRKQDRARQIEEMKRQRARQEQLQNYLGTLNQRMTQGVSLPEGMQGPVRPAPARNQVLGELAAMTGDPSYALEAVKPPEMTKLQEQLQILGALQQMSPENRKMYTDVFGKGGTTVNVGGSDSPYQENVLETLGKERGKQVVTLEQEVNDLTTEAGGTEQALNILDSNQGIAIRPTAKVEASALSMFAPFLTEDQLKNVSDFQQLDAQLIRNRFNLTKVLKGAITEKEQEAAQIASGNPTGTREGLRKTLVNNIAYATLQADYKARQAQYIMEQGENYSPKKFNQYYKELGEQGLRPTLDSIVDQYSVQTQANTQGVPQDIQEIMNKYGR